MIVNSLYFNLDRSEYPNDYGYELLLKSRYYCNYIERNVFKPLKVEAPGFNRISITFSNVAAPAYVNSQKVLCVRALFDKDEYERAKKGNPADFYISNFEKVLPSLAKDGYDLPVSGILDANRTFASNGYENRWLHKKKTDKRLGITAALYCELSATEFTLTLRLVRGADVVYDKIIFTEVPDPVAYEYRFRDIVFTESSVIVTHKLSEGNLIEIDLCRLMGKE